MASQQYSYQKRAVAFLDVLGFKQMLIDFEADARAETEDEGREYWQSAKVDDFINTVKDVLGLLDSNKFRYYLFSDNICITVDFLESPDILSELLLTITDLYYEFAKKGYFLRGGIDIGKFVDEEKIALGIPLANAYKLESEIAVYPRIVLSSAFMDTLTLSAGEDTNLQSWLDTLLIRNSCELSFLNVFHAVFRKEDRVSFFRTYKNKLEQKLLQSNNTESVHVKYAWLAIQHNDYLDEFKNIFIYQSREEPEQAELDELAAQKIDLRTNIQFV